MSKLPLSTMERESPVERLSEPDHWAAPGAVDLEVLMSKARSERDRAVAEALRTSAAAAAGLWRKLVAEPFARWRERERTIRELSSLREHELAELGIAPGMIPYIASGKLQAEGSAAAGSTAPANENARVRRVA